MPTSFTMASPFSCILFGTLFYVAHKLNACSTAQDDPNCGIWVPAGFCQDSFYTCDQKRTYCGSACNIGSCNPLTTCSSSAASSNESCTDSSSSCLTWVTNGFCTSSSYTCNQKMQYCAKSCNIGGCDPQVTCGSDDQTTTCTNQDDPRCAIWVPNGFCQTSLYTCDQKRTYCGSACNIGSCNPLTTCSSSGASSNAPESCTDSNSSCLTWVTNGFCTATFYTCNQKMQYCAKSCNIGGCNPQVTCGSGGQTTTTPTTILAQTTTTPTTILAQTTTTPTTILAQTTTPTTILAQTTPTTIAPTTQPAPGTCTITYNNTDISPGSHDISTKLGQLTDCCSLCNSTAGCKAYVWDNGQGGECFLKSATGPLSLNQNGKMSGILNQ